MARTSYKPLSLAKSLLTECPRSKKQQLTEIAKKAVILKDHQQRLDHSKILPRQGQTFKGDLEAALWADVVTTLPDSPMKFALLKIPSLTTKTSTCEKRSPQTPVLCVDSDKLLSTY